MTVNQKPQWDAVEVAARAMKMTDLSKLTIEEVHSMAARILDDERNAPGSNRTDPKPDLINPLEKKPSLASDLLKKMSDFHESKKSNPG